MSCTKTIRYSADELIKNKPEKLEGIEFICDEGTLYSIKVNGVDIFAKTYKMVYGTSYAIMKFYNNKNEYIACVSVFGSNKEYAKDDEYLIVGYGTVVSETGMRMAENSMK